MYENDYTSYKNRKKHNYPNFKDEIWKILAARLKKRNKSLSE